MKILVTGASGFVGSALCARLASDKIPFVGAVRKRGVEPQFEIGELNGRVDWSKALYGCDAVIHLAARVHMMTDKASDPLAAFRVVNVEATLNLARQAIDQGIKRFVFVSSVKVNGEETRQGAAFSSSDEPAPLDAYGQSKLEAEMALLELSRSSDLEIVIVRPPLVYGPGVRANFLNLMQLVKFGAPLPLGGIHNCRSFVALDNLVDLLVTCVHHPLAVGNIFMVSDDSDVSTSELIQMLAAAMERRLFLLPVPTRILSAAAVMLGKPSIASRLLGSLQVDIGLTKSTLGWNPIISMEEAINHTVTHFLSQQ